MRKCDSSYVERERRERERKKEQEREREKEKVKSIENSSLNRVRKSLRSVNLQENCRIEKYRSTGRSDSE